MVAAAFAACACAMTPYQDAYHTRIIQTWVGKDVSKLWASWGPPSRRMTAPDGSEYHIYFQKVAKPAEADSSNEDSLLAAATDPNCETYFVVPPKKRIIQAARWRGTTCPVHAPQPGRPFLMKPAGPVGF
jgi:hypothetical protein